MPWLGYEGNDLGDRWCYFLDRLCEEVPEKITKSVYWMERNINAKNGALKAGAERAAINAPLQGTNADIIKMVMPVFENAYVKGETKARLLMQVHDELIFEVPEGALEAESAFIRKHMEQIVKLDVPLKVGLGHGHTWEDAH